MKRQDTSRKMSRMRRLAVSLMMLCAAMFAGVLVPGALFGTAVCAEETATSGTWGDLTWRYEEETETLYIEGEGATPYLTADDEKIASLPGEVNEISFGEGITHISAFDLYEATHPVTVTLSSTVDYYGAVYSVSIPALPVEKFQVSADNAVFEVRDDSLFNKESHTLECLAMSVTQESYVLPDDIVIVKAGALINAQIKTLILHKDVTDVKGIDSWTSDKLQEVYLYALKAPNFYLDQGSSKTIHVPEKGFGYDVSDWESCQTDSDIRIVKDLGGELDPEETSGKCGDNAFWTVSEDGLLDIQGSGPMYDLPRQNAERWNGWDDVSNTCFIREIHIAEGITHIGDYVFDNFDGVTEVELPDSVQSIGKGAFGNCHYLRQVHFSDHMNVIGEDAFCCSGLTSVILPSNLKTIASGAFSHAQSLTEATISESVEIMGDGVFDGCDSLKTIVFEGEKPEYQHLLKPENHLGDPVTVRYYLDSGTWTDLDDHDGHIIWKGVCKEHKWEDDEILAEPTREDDGLMRQVCTQCGSTRETIIPAESMIRITPDITQSRSWFAFNGKDHRPEITVKDEEGNQLQEVYDYMIDWPEDVSSYGEHTATVRFVHKYKINDPVDVTWTIGPKTPQITMIQDGDEITVKWQRQSDADGFILQYSSIKDKSFENPQTFMIEDGTATSYKFTKPEKDATSFYIRLQSYKEAGGDTLYSSWDTMMMEDGVFSEGDGSGTVLPATSKIKCSWRYNTIHVRWNKVQGATGYQISIKLSKSKEWINPYGIIKRRTADFSDPAPVTWYKIKVVAMRGKHKGKSKIVSFLTPPAETVFTKAKAGKASVSLKWQARKGAKKYRVYIFSQKKGRWISYRTIKKTHIKIKTKKAKLRKGKIYWFTVAPVNRKGTEGNGAVPVMIRIRP